MFLSGQDLLTDNDVVISEINPDYQYNADETDAPTAKRKVVKGGSWKTLLLF